MRCMSSRWAATTCVTRWGRTRPITPASSSRRSAPSAPTSCRLYGAGARRFLVWNAPNPALTPALRRLASVNPNIAPLATFLTQSFNGNLGGLLTELSELPGATIEPARRLQPAHDIVFDGDRFGLTNVTDACITPNEPPFACTNPDEYLFWDGIHPTSAVHGIIAQLAASVLGQ